MPHIDGIEVPAYTKEDHKADRRATWLKWYKNTRSKAIASLGGKCKCGEDNPNELHIVGLTVEAKEWSQLLFYKRLIDAYSNGDDPTKLGKVICRRCRFKGMTLAAIERRKARVGTGEFFWIGGQRVEQIRNLTGRDKNGHLIVHPRYEDLGVSELEDEGTRTRVLN